MRSGRPVLCTPTMKGETLCTALAWPTASAVDSRGACHGRRALAPRSDCGEFSWHERNPADQALSWKASQTSALMKQQGVSATSTGFTSLMDAMLSPRSWMPICHPCPNHSWRVPDDPAMICSERRRRCATVWPPNSRLPILTLFLCCLPRRCRSKTRRWQIRCNRPFFPFPAPEGVPCNTMSPVASLLLGSPLQRRPLGGQRRSLPYRGDAEKLLCEFLHGLVWSRRKKLILTVFAKL